VSERIGLGRSSRRGCALGRIQRLARLARAKCQTGGAGRREPPGPWPVRPRLVQHDVSDGASAPIGADLDGPRGSTRLERSAASPGSGGRHGGWLQPHPEVSSQFSASWARRVDELGPGIGRSCGCARGLFWLQKSTRGTWSKSATVTGNRRGERWV
jgi:hypothetical protein